MKKPILEAIFKLSLMLKNQNFSLMSFETFPEYRFFEESY